MLIRKELLEFLSDLEKNNNRDWFNERKPVFKAHQESVKSFFAHIHRRLGECDKVESHKIWRIYNDVRFSKNKLPYKTRFGGTFKRSTALLRGGYYLNLEPGGKSAVGGGFYAPEKKDLLRIRKEFEASDQAIRKILSDKEFVALFGKLEGSELKTAPKGFNKNHKAIDLIKKKNFYAVRRFTDQEVLEPNFADEVIKSFLALRPYFDYMSAVLTTNLNGESIL